ncbi:hypothetical protein B0H10DRAFT_587068 [Mycena sp. CBHHK59/15]|nr:hypothetical protein B0H10DRAFT_587068 [Mycena sp. CBHHK59/15]
MIPQHPHASAAATPTTTTPTHTARLRHQLSRIFSRARRNRDRSSTKHTPPSTTPPRNPLPELPPELWILILEYSTYPSCTPSASSADCAAPPPSLELPASFLSPALTPTSLSPRLLHYRKTMRHKRSLTLVSKNWHSYAQPVLYAFVWIARAAQARLLARTLLAYPGAGRCLRRLHIETPALERCNPDDLRTILDCAPGLEVYSDYRSVRRSFVERCGPEQLVAALAHGGALRRLSWTNYDDPALVGLGLGLGCAGGHMGARLEYLELNFVSSAVECAPAPAAGVEAGARGLVLPALRTLKVTLDNATFAVLATWGLPALRNLSVLSADFSYASAGFARFFHVHGPALRQLELGHSTSRIEEHYLTAPRDGVVGAPSLAEWCPHLEEFVCSADAEWNWQNPDWIAPHLLLPAHPTVTLIGIRGIDARLWGAHDGDGDAFFGLREQVESLLRREAFPKLKYVGYERGERYAQARHGGAWERGR